MAATLSYFCELVDGEENKLTTFSTWTIMLGCNESNIIFQQHLCKLGQLRRSNDRHLQVFGQNLWPQHFRTFCELVEGEENKLTTFSTWTIMLGCNESNIISSSISANLGNSREAMVEIRKYSVKQLRRDQLAHYKKYSHFKGRDTAPTTSERFANPFTRTIYGYTYFRAW